MLKGGEAGDRLAPHAKGRHTVRENFFGVRDDLENRATERLERVALRLINTSQVPVNILSRHRTTSPRCRASSPACTTPAPPDRSGSTPPAHSGRTSRGYGADNTYGLQQQTPRLGGPNRGNTHADAAKLHQRWLHRCRADARAVPDRPARRRPAPYWLGTGTCGRGASMEPSGRNRSQPLANAIVAKAAQRGDTATAGNPRK
jgi:hypothetical protein